LENQTKLVRYTLLVLLWREESLQEKTTVSRIEAMEWITMDDGIRLYLRRWDLPAEAARAGNSPRAVLHIIHGMAEHSLRYERLARRLNEEGIAVWAADQRGHGRPADTKINDLGRGGLLGHCADRDGFSRVTVDIDIINRSIETEYPGVPLFLLGHSWGSFIAQNYIETWGGLNPPGPSPPIGLAGCILSGTRGPGGLDLKLGVPVLAFLAFRKRSRGRSKLARSLSVGSYNKAFRPNRTGFDWLSRDEGEVDAYVKDPLCGKLCTSGFYRDLAAGLKQIHSEESLARIRRDLPIYVFSGSADPVGAMGESLTALLSAYRSLGIMDLEFVLYPDARHETLNETNREEVTGSLISWLLRHA
jgi:alpha-beta hydrolase superfamily lysophospholipase